MDIREFYPNFAFMNTGQKIGFARPQQEGEKTSWKMW